MINVSFLCIDLFSVEMISTEPTEVGETESILQKQSVEIVLIGQRSSLFSLVPLICSILESDFIMKHEVVAEDKLLIIPDSFIF